RHCDACPAERVCGPCHREDGPDAEPPRIADAAVDVMAAALRDVHLLAAAEQVGGLDPDQHRELAALDHVPRLARVVDEPEPTPALAAGLRVDVVLQTTQLLHLLANRGGLIAGMRLHRFDLADRLVLN